MVAKKRSLNNKDILITFEKNTGLTGYFSSDELNLLTEYCLTRQQTPFISRLYDLGVLVSFSNEDLEYLLNKIQNTEYDSSLKSLHIELTDNCPLLCKECYKGSPRPIFMDFKKFEKLISEAEDLSIFQIALGGGEPLSHPEIIDFVKLIGKTNMSATITTSGLGLTEELLNKLIRAGLNHIQISLNSIDEKINSVTRDGYQYAVSAISLLKNSNISWGVNIVLHKDNIKSLASTIEYAKSMSAKNVNLLRFKPPDKKSHLLNSLHEDDFYQVLDVIKKIKGIKVKVDSANSYILKGLWGDMAEKGFSGCGAYKDFIAVTPDLDFKPCSHMLRKDSASTIQSYMDMNLDINISPMCAECKYAMSCGGCIAICEKIGHINCPVFK